MKITRLILVALTTFLSAALAHSADTNALPDSRQAQLAERAIWQAKADNWYRSRTDIQWGETTNGLKCGISLMSWPDLYFYVQAPLTNIPYPQLSPDDTHLTVKKAAAWTGNGVPVETGMVPVWIGAPNGLFGPMELRDAAGQKVKLLKPELELAGTYPDFLDWGLLRMRIGGLPGNLDRMHTGQWQEFNRHGDIQLAEGRPLALKDVLRSKSPAPIS